MCLHYLKISDEPTILLSNFCKCIIWRVMTLLQKTTFTNICVRTQPINQATTLWYKIWQTSYESTHMHAILTTYFIAQSEGIWISISGWTNLLTHLHGFKSSKSIIGSLQLHMSLHKSFTYEYWIICKFTSISL